jgi:cation transport ATPase
MDASCRSLASICPGCGQTIDPLRAGHVAILEGGFRYFCGPSCKLAFVDASAMRPTLEAFTVDPPPVAARRSGEMSSPLVIDARVPTELLASAHVEQDTVAAVDEEVSTSLPESRPRMASGIELRTSRSDVEPIALVAREQVREPGDPVAAPTPVSGARRWLAFAPEAGVALAVASAICALLGIAQLPSVLATTAGLVAGYVLVALPAWPNDRTRWVSLAAVATGILGTLAGGVGSSPHADAYALYLALLVFVAMVTYRLVRRAWNDITAISVRSAHVLNARVRVERAGIAVDADLQSVKPGERVLVDAGETLCVDGEVVDGQATVAPWLDASVRVSKRAGDSILAGARVCSGSLRVKVTCTLAERLWFARGGQGGDAPLAAVTRRVVERGAPLAALFSGLAAYANNGGVADVLVGASAGAFALSGAAVAALFGVSYARSHQEAQRKGILFRDAAAFDAAGRVEVAVLCTQGAVLRGEPELVAVDAVNTRTSRASIGPEHDEVSWVLSLAAALEEASTEAMGSPLRRAARARGMAWDAVRSPTTYPGLGVAGTLANGTRVLLGSRAFLLDEKVSVAVVDARVTDLEASGRQVLAVALGDRLVGIVALQDGLRPFARAAVKCMCDAHIEPVLLGGEARETSETLARALDIEHVRPEVVPSDRGAEVRALADGGRIVAVIGNPRMDDGALGSADVSIALDAGATAFDWSVFLADDDVRNAAFALVLARSYRTRTRVALVSAAVLSGLSLLAVAVGVAPPFLVPLVALVTVGVLFGSVRIRT